MNGLQVDDNPVGDLDSLITKHVIFKKLVEHPVEEIPEVIPLGGEEFDHLVEVGGQGKFICLGVVEKIDENVAEGVYFVIGGGQHEDSWEIVDHVVQYSLVF